jgi:hypothetical protein
MRGLLLVLGACALALACSGKSDADFDDKDDGGSPPMGGTNSGGGGNGGTAGTSSAGKGGAVTGGSGGASTGGTSGTAGTGAMRGYHPPDRQAMGCAQTCEREQAAMCPNEGSYEQCVSGCLVGLQFESCSADWDAVFACVGTAGPATCDANGEAVVSDCRTELEAAIGCVVTVVGGSSVTTQCSANCRAAAAAMCPNADTTESCNFDCNAVATAFPVCQATYSAAIACAGGAEHTCDADGEPQPVGCNGATGDFVDCLSAEYDWQI